MSILLLFLNSRIVLESSILDGGVLVNGNGVIQMVLNKTESEKYLGRNDVQVIDTSNMGYLMAGIVDSHVHVNEPGRTDWEGFTTATQAAAAGGVTTIVDMPLNSIPPTTTLENFKTKLRAAKDQIYVDTAFWGGVIPGNENDLIDLVEAGVVGFKCFLCESGVDEFPYVEEEDIKKAFAVLEGTDAVLAFHAELEQDEVSGDNVTGDPHAYVTYLKTRPDQMEVDALKLIASLAADNDVRVHIVHVSSAEGVAVIEGLRQIRQQRSNTAWNNGVTAETCNHYLTFSAEQIPDGRTEFKCSPPIRDEENREKLWNYMLEEKLNLVVSDHSPCPANLKSSNFLESWGGISSMQFDLPLFWTEGQKYGVTLNDVTRLMSIHTSKLCGLTSKGSIAPGKDADLIVFNPDEKFVVTKEIIRHKNKISPYIGKELQGVVKQTFLRGKLIYADDKLSSEPHGKLLAKLQV